MSMGCHALVEDFMLTVHAIDKLQFLCRGCLSAVAPAERNLRAFFFESL